MRQTLFFVPHWFLDGPLLVAWLIISVLILIGLFLRHGNSNQTWSFVPVIALVAVIIQFVIPVLEVDGLNPVDPTQRIPLGLAVRGYGVCLLLAISAGVATAMTRCQQVNISSEQILSLGFWLMISGIVGARIFYVVQKSDEFFVPGATFVETFRSVTDMTKGGLVVYGSLIGAMLAGSVYLLRNKMPVFKTADLIAPSMVLGLAIGRIGCLMNGCCFGGVCDAPLPSVTFPAGSPPYMRQLSQGDLIGIKAKLNEDKNSTYPLIVEELKPNSIAANLGMLPGDLFLLMPPYDEDIRFQKTHGEESYGELKLVGYVKSERQGELDFPVKELPARSLDTHPTQIYSAINAALLSLVLWFYWTIRKSDGEVFALMLILYSIGRFLMELIRQDEFGQFGTQFTISQWVSVCMVLLGAAVFVFVRSSRSSDIAPRELAN